MSDVPKCQCDAPGDCPHLQREMVGRMYDLCSGSNGVTPVQSERYRRKWFLGQLNVKAGDIEALQSSTGCCKKRPSAIKQAATFARTMAQWARDGFKHASAAEQEERLQICESCPLLGDNVRCAACGCFVKPKAALRVSYCPAGKWFVEQQGTDDVTGPRNLMMHIMPVSGNGVWEWNVEQLLKRIHLFDGKRALAMVTDTGRYETADPHEVLERFAGHRIDTVIVQKNSTKLREAATWPKLLSALKDEPGVTFACHAKGVTHSLDSVVIQWADVMWQTCLDDMESVLRALSQYPMAGSFKRYGQFRTNGNHRRYYSGTFYWFRNQDVFSRDWSRIDQRFFGNESWPGLHFKPTEAACLFCDDAPDLYKSNSWNDRVSEEWNNWRAART